MKKLFAALALSAALPTVAHAANAPAEKDCCDKMKVQKKKCCCCDEKAMQPSADHDRDHAGHEGASTQGQ
jgi:hypothetical protein